MGTLKTQDGGMVTGEKRVRFLRLGSIFIILILVTACGGPQSTVGNTPSGAGDDSAQGTADELTPDPKLPMLFEFIATPTLDIDSQGDWVVNTADGQQTTLLWRVPFDDTLCSDIDFYDSVDVNAKFQHASVSDGLAEIDLLKDFLTSWTIAKEYDDPDTLIGDVVFELDFTSTNLADKEYFITTTMTRLPCHLGATDEADTIEEGETVEWSFYLRYTN